MTHAIGTLCGYSFLSRREDSEIFDMHSLVHSATRMWDEEQSLGTEMRHMALARLADVFPTDEWENRDLWRQYLPQALKVLGAAGSAEDKEMCELGIWVGRCLLQDGRVREAVERLKDVVVVVAKTMAEDHPYRLQVQHELTQAYLANGQTKEAVELLEHVVAIHEKILAEDHPDRLASQHELAQAYLANGQIKKAVELLEHVVAMKKEIMAETHPNRLVSEELL